MIPIDQVDDLIRAVADENNLELASLLPGIAQGNFASFRSFLSVFWYACESRA